MEIPRFLPLSAVLIMAIMTFYVTPTNACMCMPEHPQQHYCRADYVALVRVMRKSTKLVEGKVVYKVEVKKSYKMTPEGQQTLKHGRIMTSGHDSLCGGFDLQLGRLYVIASRGPQLNMCHYAKEYKKMSIIERTGFTGAYKKGCGCEISFCRGNRCPATDDNSCSWSPFARCETDYSACMPIRNHRSPFTTTDPSIKCRWRRTVAYDECKMSP
ncbi:tissue inhibitor of metalloproteases [Musca autumnalis]|uniref:tissue inhibitor of metalloproteases n=1 Tax=Musca autumnalis TaxID=221902 RepID=UPI003CF02601